MGPPASSPATELQLKAASEAGFSITITNRTGLIQNYALFAKAPDISPAPAAEDLHTNVMVAFRGVSNNTGQAFISMPCKRLFALCGTCNDQGRDDSITVEIIDSMPVQIGASTGRGQLVPGTTCEVVVKDNSPTFAPSSTSPDLGQEGAFVIQTRPDFTYLEARAHDYVLGLSISPKLFRDIGPLALFVPKPNERYTVKPSRTFYIVSSGARARDPVTQSMRDSAVEVNFDTRNTNEVHIVHSDRGELTVQEKSVL